MNRTITLDSGYATVALTLSLRWESAETGRARRDVAISIMRFDRSSLDHGDDLRSGSPAPSRELASSRLSHEAGIASTPRRARRDLDRAFGVVFAPNHDRCRSSRSRASASSSNVGALDIGVISVVRTLDDICIAAPGSGALAISIMRLDVASSRISMMATSSRSTSPSRGSSSSRMSRSGALEDVVRASRSRSCASLSSLHRITIAGGRRGLGPSLRARTSALSISASSRSSLSRRHPHRCRRPSMTTDRSIKKVGLRIAPLDAGRARS